MQIIHPRPRIVRTTRHQPAGIIIHRSTGNLVPEIRLLEQSARRRPVKQVHGFARGDSQNPWVIRARRKRIQFAAAYGALHSVLEHGVSRAQIPPADLSVLSRRGEDVVIAVPDDGFDGAAMHAGADLVARRCACACSGRLGRRGGRQRRRGTAAVAAAAREVEDAELFLEAARRDDLRRGLEREGDGAADVRVLQGVQAFAGVGVPDFAVAED